AGWDGPRRAATAVQSVPARHVASAPSTSATHAAAAATILVRERIVRLRLARPAGRYFAEAGRFLPRPAMTRSGLACRRGERRFRWHAKILNARSVRRGAGEGGAGRRIFSAARGTKARRKKTGKNHGHDRATHGSPFSRLPRPRLRASRHGDRRARAGLSRPGIARQGPPRVKPRAETGRRSAKRIPATQGARHGLSSAHSP